MHSYTFAYIICLTVRIDLQRIKNSLSLSKLHLLSPCILCHIAPPTHAPFPPPCSTSPLPPFQSSTLFSLSLFHLGGIWWTGCPVPDQADYQGLALPYCTLCTIQLRVGVPCSFSLGFLSINAQRANCMSIQIYHGGPHCNKSAS